MEIQRSFSLFVYKSFFFSFKVFLRLYIEQFAKKLTSHLSLGGTKECWEENYIDSSYARLVAEQRIWAFTNSAIQSTGQAFNAVNGSSFTWKKIGDDIGLKIGLEIPKKKKEMEDKG